MKKRWGGAWIAACFLPLTAASYYCSTPQGSGFINQGDTIEQVKQACGAKPTEFNETQPLSNKVMRQYWLYDNANIVNESTLAINGGTRAINRTGPVLLFEITNGTITEITESGKAVNSTDQCRGASGNVNKGDSIDNLLRHCGKASQVTMQPSEEEAGTQEITILTYDQGDYAEPLILQFTDGKLTKLPN